MLSAKWWPFCYGLSVLKATKFDVMQNFCRKISDCACGFILCFLSYMCFLRASTLVLNLKKIYKNTFAFFNVSLYWVGAGCWNHFSWKTRTHWSCIANSHSCSWLGDVRSQGISSHGVDIIIVEYSGLSTIRLRYAELYTECYRCRWFITYLISVLSDSVPISYVHSLITPMTRETIKYFWNSLYMCFVYWLYTLCGTSWEWLSFRILPNARWSSINR